MSIQRERAIQAEHRLAQLGIDVRVEAAGAKEEIAVIRPMGARGARGARRFDELVGLGELRDRVVGECRAAGFRYVALELF